MYADSIYVQMLLQCKLCSALENSYSTLARHTAAMLAVITMLRE